MRGEDVHLSVRDYLKQGWVLCPIPEKTKAPTLPGWNRLDKSVFRLDQIERITGNVGLLHAYSGTVAIDVDDYHLAKPFLLQGGIDLDALLTAPGAVLIDSGVQNRCKLLYRSPEPLQYKKLSRHGLELRCADSNGGSVQDLLPPSIHPNGNPYRWAGSGHYSQLPPLPPELLDFWLSCENEKLNVSSSIPEGTRNNTLTSLAGKLRYEGQDTESMVEVLLQTNKTQCRPPLPAKEIATIARSVSKYKPGNGGRYIDDEGTAEEGDPLIPAGDYLVAYVRHEIQQNCHGYGPKIIVWFRVTEGGYEGSCIRLFYNIEVAGRKWISLPGSRLSIEMLRLFPSARKDRISPALLRGHTILARVGSNRRGTYSVVKELLEMEK